MKPIYSQNLKSNIAKGNKLASCRRESNVSSARSHLSSRSYSWYSDMLTWWKKSNQEIGAREKFMTSLRLVRLQQVRVELAKQLTFRIYVTENFNASKPFNLLGSTSSTGPPSPDSSVTSFQRMSL